MPTRVLVAVVVGFFLVVAAILAVQSCAAPPPQPLPTFDPHVRGEWFKAGIAEQRRTADTAGLLGSSIIPTVYEPELHGQQ